MSNKKSISMRQTISQQAEVLCKKYGFNKAEMEKLLNKYRQVTATSTNSMDRSLLRNCLHHIFQITDDVIMDRVFKAFDKDNDSQVSQEEWIRGFWILLRGTSEERMVFCFDVYDQNSDGFISREEMFNLLKSSVVNKSTDEDPDEGVKDLIELTLKKMDFDHDNRISFKDYQKSVTEETLLLEFLGSCLPSEKTITQIESMLASDTDSFEKIPVTARCNYTGSHSEGQTRD